MLYVIVLPSAYAKKAFCIDVIEKILGHQSVPTTKAYIRKFGAEVLDETVEVLSR